MHNAKIKLISLAVCFSLMPLVADAAGLGKLTVISGLGEPLNAEVELLSTTKDELSSLTAQIAPNEVFAEQGVERASILSAVRVEVSKRPDGTPVLHLSSLQPINDPFLDMLIQVEWSSGRLLREYTALLDPPGYNSQPTTSAPALPSTSSQAAPVPGAAAEALSRKSQSHRDAAGTAKTPAVEGAAAQQGEHVVQKGDTLRAIAAQSQVDGVSLEQMLVGLYRANKPAFAGNNMNRLKVGQIVHIPEGAELQAIPQAEAVKEIRVQTANWNAYRSKLAGMAEASTAAKEESSSQMASGKISAPAEDKSSVAAPGPHDVVKLSKSEAAAAAKTEAKASQRLSAMQEDAIAREKALKEADSRVASLEKQLQDMQKLLDIKNKSLADAQNGAKASEAAKPVPMPAQPPKVETPPPPPVAAPAPEAPKPEAQPEQKKPKKIVRPAPVPLPEPSLIDTVLDNPLFLAAGGGGLLALLGGAWVFMRNKRRKGLDSFEQGILTTGGLKPNTVFGNTVGGTVDTGTTSFLTDFGQSANAGMIDTNDVDPIAEAEVYMAYGRDVQAEEILKDAISKEPKRYELHLKLLEIFAHRKDIPSFETLAGELYAAVGASDPIWAKAAELGRGLEPGNPLYGEASSAADAAPEAKAEPVDFEATMIQQVPMAPSDDLELGLGTEAATLDFSLDSPEKDEQPVAEESNALDFDLGGLEMPADEPAVEQATETLPDLEASLAELDAAGSSSSELEPSVPEATGEQETAGLDFNFELPEPAAEENTQLDVADLGMEAMPETSVPASDNTVADMSLDLPELEMPTSGIEAPDELSLPELELPALEPAQEPVPKVSANDEAEAESLDLSALEAFEPMPEMAAAPAEESAAIEFPATEATMEEVTLGQSTETPETEEASFDIDFSNFETLTAKEEAAPAETEAAAEEASGLDFNFDVDLGDLDAAPTSVASSSATSLPDLDLSNIDLDVAENASAGNLATEEITLSAAESPDVDTKLDLVTAYIDMGDSEGARELLEEVLKEGGPGQREKAQKLLDGLD